MLASQRIGSHGCEQVGVEYIVLCWLGLACESGSDWSEEFSARLLADRV